MTELLTEQLAGILRQRVASMEVIGGTVLLDFGDDQGILIDGHQLPMDVRIASCEADCRVRVEPELLKEILDGHYHAIMGFMWGRIGISGDMCVAIKLQPLLA
jgi:putative sterol carrier protein